VTIANLISARANDEYLFRQPGRRFRQQHAVAASALDQSTMK